MELGHVGAMDAVAFRTQAHPARAERIIFSGPDHDAGAVIVGFGTRLMMRNSPSGVGVEGLPTATS